MSQKEAVNYWVTSSEEDWDVAQNLFKSAKFNYALFFMQLCLEKLIKAIYIVRKDGNPLYVHNLVLLSQKADIKLSDEDLTDLKEISSFNISTRYDNYKRDFYKKATGEYASEWMERGEKLKIKLTNFVK